MTDPRPPRSAHALFGGIARYGCAADHRSGDHEQRVISGRFPPGVGNRNLCYKKSLPWERRQLDTRLTAQRRSAPITMTDRGVHDGAIWVFTMAGIRNQRRRRGGHEPGRT